MGLDSAGHPAKGLSARWIEQAVEGSLKRLGVEVIDHYFSHRPDDSVPQTETLAAYDRLIKSGKVRSIGASNFSTAQLQQALTTAEVEGLPRYTSIQPEYNLYDRAALEGPMLALCVAQGLGVIPYYGLASGFLSGLYRTAASTEGKARKDSLDGYRTPRGLAILDALDSVAAQHQATCAQVALAWVAAQPGLTGPIASATSAAQVRDLVAAAELALTADDLALLNAASA